MKFEREMIGRRKEKKQKKGRGSVSAKEPGRFEKGLAKRRRKPEWGRAETASGGPRRVFGRASLRKGRDRKKSPKSQGKTSNLRESLESLRRCDKDNLGGGLQH